MCRGRLKAILRCQTLFQSLKIPGIVKGLVLMDGGDGKYYLWHDVSDDALEGYERNLTKILSTS